MFAQGLLTLSPSLSRPLSICCSLSPRFSHSLKGTLICCRQGKLPSLLARTGEAQMHVHNCTPTQTHGCTLIHKSHKHQHTHTNTRLYAYALAPTHTHMGIHLLVHTNTSTQKHTHKASAKGFSSLFDRLPATLINGCRTSTRLPTCTHTHTTIH